ncbi:hypothetical protein D9M68_735210 [compost metagenome]
MVGQLFDHHCGCCGWVLEPASANFGSKGDAEQARASHLGEQITGEGCDRFLGMANCISYWCDMLISEAANLLANGQDFFWGIQVVVQAVLVTGNSRVSSDIGKIAHECPRMELGSNVARTVESLM